MTPARRPSTAIIVVVALGFATMLMIVVLGLLVIIQRRLPPLATAMTTPSPSIAVLPITAVPTVAYSPSRVLAPLPSVTATSPISAYLATRVPMSVQPEVPASIPGPLANPNLDPYVGPVSVPLEIQIPALKIKAPVLGVGLTLTNAMASPIGMFPDDPIWQSVFWYRGGVIPGDVGTATFAGHFDDALGRPAVFAFLVIKNRRPDRRPG